MKNRTRLILGAILLCAVLGLQLWMILHGESPGVYGSIVITLLLVKIILDANTEER